MSMSRAELEALGVTCDLSTAARALSIGVTTAYELANRSEFPCRVLRIGTRWVVPTAGLRALIDPTTAEEAS